MHPSTTEPFGSQRGDRDTRAPAPAPAPTAAATLAPAPWNADSPSPLMPSTSQASLRGLRSEDSWIEVPSRPSSSSVSLASNDHIVTTGLVVRPSDERPSRRLHPRAHLGPPQPRSVSAAGSSQDEYEESESESDRVLSSSNEDLSQDDRPLAPQEADDDDTATALGVHGGDRVFTPQPNAFSHPPSSHTRHIPDSYFAAPHASPSTAAAQRTVTQRSYQRHTRSRMRTGASSYQPDHDAALRASLTTLLSCAAAVRPKGSDTRAPPSTTTRPAAQPTALRLVPESELTEAGPPRRVSSPKQGKRKSRESSKERHAKKARGAKSAAAAADDDLISPTLASWMISAGVVLVFSAISFSAGYAWGREVGRLDAEMAGAGGSCGREALRGTGGGLRRLRWSSAASSIQA